MRASYVDYQGERIKLAELCRRFSIDRRTVVSRLNKGMALEEALKTPTREYPSGVSRARQSIPKPRPFEPPKEKTALQKFHEAIDQANAVSRIEQATNVRLAQGPVLDMGAEIMVMLMNAVSSVNGELAASHTRLLRDARAWLNLIGWQR